MTVEEHMNIWKKKEPWIYSSLVFNKYTYYLIMSVVVCLVVYGVAFFPVVSNVAAAIVGYVLSQFIFQMGHMTTHALYIEAEKELWEPGVLVAYLHHYESPKAIYEYWLIHRLNFILQTKGSLVAYGLAWIAPFLLFGESISLLYIWFLFWFAMVEPAHEWYHVPKSKRKTHFSLPMYSTLRFLSSVGILDEKSHAKHHSHFSYDKVTKFSDLYLPFSDRVFDCLWSLALKARDIKLFKKNPIRRAIYAYGVVLVPSVFSLGSYLFLLGEHYGL